MTHALSRAALFACALGVSFSLQAQQPTSVASSPASQQIRLRYATFDPTLGEPVMPATLRDRGNLWIVQFAGIPTQEGRDAVTATGAQIHGYLPDHAYVVRMSAATVSAVRALGVTRSVTRYHPAFRLDPALLAELEEGGIDEVRTYHIVVVDKHLDKPALAAGILAIGGRVVSEEEGSLLFTVSLDGEQLQKAAALDEVLWIDEATAPEEDMNNARIQGGGNYVETQGGYTGSGVNVHIYEGIEAGHMDFTGGATNVMSGGAAQSHGHCTAGIVFGNGSSTPNARGMAPDCTKFYTNYSSVTSSRWNVINTLVNTYNVSHTTASWGDARTTSYTAVSADADDIIFDHDIAWTQSQSNSGGQMSRPQAWAKNIFSIGGVAHFNNSNPLDDSWSAGNGSTGPAADGRIKPTLSAYYDSILCSDRTGSAGYSSGNYYSNFGGTSGATPIVAGHNVLAIQMFTDETGHPGFGPFGNPLRNPGGSVHSNRPHFPTLKALQVASAAQWAFSGVNANNSRFHVGWGFPNLKTMWDNRAKTLVIDETDVLTQGNFTRHDVNVAPNEPAFRAVLNYAEQAANPGAAVTLINNLSLKVTDPTGQVWWGNNQITTGNWSSPGGTEDAINPIEVVFVQNPTPGVWHVDVLATSIAVDSHVETPAVDADYGLVVVGGTAQPSTSAYFLKFGQGCNGSQSTTTPCAEKNPAGGTLTGSTEAKEVAVLVQITAPMQVQEVSLFLRSTGGQRTVTARIYSSITSPAPLATTTMTVGPTAGFYTAAFASPVSVASSFFFSIDISAQTVVVPNLTTGTTGIIFMRPPAGGSWTYSSVYRYPAYSVKCVAGTVYDVPLLDHVGLPVLGTTYDITLSDALPSTAALMMTGFSDSTYNGQSLPYQLPGAPGCELLVAPMATHLLMTSGTGTASDSFSVPNSNSLIGLDMYHQWAVVDNANSLGIVVSDAGKAHVGT